MRKTHKLLSFVLVFALVLTSLWTGSSGTYAHAEETAALISSKLEEGSQAHGFTLNTLSDYRSINGQLQVWEHDKTGAQVYMFVNDDPERAFGILFKTEPSDDTGKLHILEHSCCAASENYPGRDVLFDLVSQGFFTDTNATTWHSSTNYYIASLDEQELKNGADYYLDCAFHGAVRNDRRYFDREAWRYVISDEKAPLEVTGVVYNEMKGVFSNIDSFTLRSVMKHLYPGSNYVYESGGDPDKILDLTYEELIEFYNRCYHPSNCSVILYGDVDYDSWLEKFDGYFAEFEREEFTAPEKYVPKGNYGTVSEDFPVSADTADISGRLLYIWDLPDTLSYSEYLALALLSVYENEITTPIMQALNASGIGSGYELSPYTYGDQKQFIAYAYDADTSRADEFKKIIDEQFAAILKSKINMETIDCIFEEQAISEALAFNTSGIGVSCIQSVTSAIEAQDIEGMIFDENVLDKAKAIFDNGKALKLFKNSVVNNDNKLLYAVTPKPGLLEENEAALTKKLADIKKAMSKKELKKVIKDSLAYDEWNNTAGTDPETLAKLITVKPSKLKIESPVYDTKITEKNGVTIATAAVDSDVSYFRYSFDISNLSVKQAQYLNEYIQYLGLATTTRTQEQVTNDARRYLTGFSANVSMQEIAGKNIPSLVLSFYAFNENLEKALDHVFDMLYNTDLENADNSAYIAQTTSYYIGAYSDPSTVNSMLSAAAGGYTSDSYALSWKLNGVPRYNMLKKAVSSEKAFNKLLKGMASVRKKVVKRQNAVVRIVGSKDSRKASVNSMLSRLPKKNKAYKAGTVSTVAKNPKSIAIEMNTQASFMLSVYSNPKASVKNNAAKMLALAIMSDAMYIPEFRYSMGAYGAACGATGDGLVYTQLYRSPEFANSYKRILETPDELANLTGMLTDEMLDGYKLQLISQFVTPSGEWNMANTELYYMVAGQDGSPSIALAKAIRKLTVEDLKKAVPSISKAFKNMGVAVIGTKDEIEANKDMFDQVITLK